MSDLISRSELLKEIEKYKFGAISNNAEREYVKTTILNFIECQPTAYDIDKVVEELQKNASRYTKKYVTPYGNNGYRDTKAISIHKAIEIVKQGCVSDDVCEWKVFNNSLTDEPQWVYETACGKYAGEEHTSKAFVYCPYCSKKIKVVE